MDEDSDMSSVDLDSIAESVPSLSCYSVDEPVLGVLWDENVKPDQLLEFSFDRIDKLAAKHGATVKPREKSKFWEYVQRMKHEQSEGSSQHTTFNDALDAMDSLSLTGTATDWSFDASGSSGPSSAHMTVRRSTSPLRDREPENAAASTSSVERKKKRKLWKRIFAKRQKKTVFGEQTFVLGVQRSSSASCMGGGSGTLGSGRLRASRLSLQSFLRRSMRRLQSGSLSRLPKPDS